MTEAVLDDVLAAAISEVVSVSVEPDESPDTRSAREKIVDHLTDTVDQGAQHISQICQGTGLSRTAVDPVLSRGVAKGVFIRDGEKGEARYRLAPEPEELPPPAEQVRVDGTTQADWLQHLNFWRDTNYSQWLGPGASPHPADGIATPGCAVPIDCWSMFRGQLAARAQRQAEDEALLAQLLEAAGGHVHKGTALTDLRPIHTMLASDIPFDRIIDAVRQHYRLGRPPISHWSSILELVAVSQALEVFAPDLLHRWQAHLDDPNGKDSRAAPSAKRALAEIAPLQAGDASGAHADPQQPADVPQAAVLLKRLGKAPETPTRADIAAAFKRQTPQSAASRSPSPAAPAQRQARPMASRPQKPGPLPDPMWSDEALDEMVEAYSKGMLAWNNRRMGPAPGEEGCRVKPYILKRHGF